MNIVILNYHRLGGSGIVAYEIGWSMANLGHNVHFVGLQTPFRLIQEDYPNIFFHKIHIKEYPVFDFQPYTLALASQLATIIEKEKIDVIHSHYALPHAVAAILAREITGIPVKCITTLHGTDITIIGSHPTMKNITLYAIEKSDVVTSVSQFLRNQTYQNFNGLKKEIQVIYNFVNPKDFNSQRSNEMHYCRKNPSQNKVPIIHMSNLREVKRPIEVLNIFAAMTKQSDINLELWIVGEGPMRPKMEEKAIELEIQDKTIFWGTRPNVVPFISASKFLILPSETESFGLAILEANACGVPVAATKVGGVPEVIENNKNGILFELHESSNMVAKKILNIIKDKKNYEKMSLASIEMTNQQFNMKSIIEKYHQIYRN